MPAQTKHLERRGIQIKYAFEKIYKYLTKETKITRKILEYYLRFIERNARKIGLNEVSSEMVRRAETRTNNILQAAINAFKTLGINLEDKGIYAFYVSKDERITAYRKAVLNKDETDKACELGIITGRKKEKYKAIKEIRLIRLFDKEKDVGKLSKTQADLIESIKNEFNTVLYSDIQNHKDIVNIIQNNKPKELENKYKTHLTTKKTNTRRTGTRSNKNLPKPTKETRIPPNREVSQTLR